VKRHTYRYLSVKETIEVDARYYETRVRKSQPQPEGNKKVQMHRV
jgi:hypothetical protein